MGSAKQVLCNLATEGIKYATEFAKNQYPKIKNHNEKIIGKFKDAAEDASPKVAKAHENVSKFVMDKYSEAVQLSKKAEEEQKKNRAKAIRHGIIATSVGFAAGAATGYLLVKKSQIKDSDYVFTDDEVVEPVKEAPAHEPAPMPEKPEPAKKTYKEFNETYQISTDGTTLIKK